MLKNLLAVFILSIFSAGCATIPADERVPEDPLQGLNRTIFKFNAGVDKAVLKPAAKTYQAVMPDIAETGVSNFFSNIGDVPTAINNLLQGKFKAAGSDSLRVLINTTVGIGGLIDVAGDSGLPKHNEDLGQTLGVWGVPSGPYLMLPLLGPSTLRDGVGSTADYFMDPTYYIGESSITDRLMIPELLDTRAGLFEVEELIDSSLYDNYEQMREVYLTTRARDIVDGEEEEDAGEDLRRELEDLDD